MYYRIGWAQIIRFVFELKRTEERTTHKIYYRQKKRKSGKRVGSKN